MKFPIFTSSRSQMSSIQQILVLFAIALIFVALVMAVFGYRIGHKQGVRSVNRALAEAQPEDASHLDAAKLKQNLDTAVQERDIGLVNLEALQVKNEELITQNLQLEQFNELLLASVAKDGGVPLKVLGAEIVSMPDRTFEYRFDVAMIDRSGQSVIMKPKLTLLNATSMVQIPLKPDTYEAKGITRIRGRFVMPDGFSPKQIKLELNAGSQRTQQLYNWQVGKVMEINENYQSLNERPIAKQSSEDK